MAKSFPWKRTPRPRPAPLPTERPAAHRLHSKWIRAASIDVSYTVINSILFHTNWNNSYFYFWVNYASVVGMFQNAFMIGDKQAFMENGKNKTLFEMLEDRIYTRETSTQ